VIEGIVTLGEFVDLAELDTHRLNSAPLSFGSPRGTGVAGQPRSLTSPVGIKPAHDHLAPPVNAVACLQHVVHVRS
jgi:hypothetical protein